MLAAMQRDLGLTATGARERIAKDYAAGRTGRALRKKLGPAFGGSWLTADAKSLVVAVTDSDMADEVTAAGATPKLVDRSAAKLDAIKAALDKAAAKAPAGVPGWYVDPKTNTVVVQARGNTAAVEDFIEASGVDDDAVRVVKTAEQPRTFGDVRGGDAFFINQDSCSVGFSVTGSENGSSVGGFVSAGHCGKAGDPTVGHDYKEQGTFRASSFPGSDYSWVAVNSKWTPRPWVNDGNGGNVIVAGSTAAAVGAAVCRSGANTGWRCGTVQALNQTVIYREKGENDVEKQFTVYGLTRTSACADAGDSGGSVLSGRQAQGVLSGGYGTCSNGGYTYVQPIGKILSAYDLTLVTSDEIAAPGPNRECKGFKISATGSLDEGGTVHVPDGSYYYTSVAGVHTGCLNGPAGNNFDLTLRRWSGTAWDDVASSATGAADESVTYKGTAGYYTWKVSATRGSGSFTLGYTHP
jgi:streptogrisin C